MSRVSTVLVADPSAQSRSETRAALSAAGHRVVFAGNADELTRAVESEGSSLVVVEGNELLDWIRRAKRGGKDGALLPVVAICVPGVGARIDALEAGADDALSRPFEPRELSARVAGLLRTRRAFDDALRGRVEGAAASTHDPLTGVHNQPYLTSRLPEEFRRAQRYQEPLSLLKVDLDGLEAVNGRYGRGAGDRLLAACARVLATTCREVDVVTRAGGDEFVVLLPNTHFAGSLAIAERLWQELRTTSVDTDVGAARCDVSLGAACFPGRDVNAPNDLLRFADGALRRAKAEGKGRVCLYQHQGYLLDVVAV